MLKTYRWLAAAALAVSVSCQAQTAAPAAAPIAVRGDFLGWPLTIRDSDGNEATVRMELRAHLSTLMGEPVVYCTGRWAVDSVTIGGKGYVQSQVPAEVWRDIDLFGINVAIPMTVRLSNIEGTTVYLPCDPGVFYGGGDKRASFNVPGSPSWDQLLLGPRWTSAAGSGMSGSLPREAYVSAKDAKAWLAQRKLDFQTTGQGAKYGSIINSELISGSINLWSVRWWAQDLERQARKARKDELRARVAATKAASGPRSKLDDVFDEVDKAEQVQEVASAKTDLAKAKALAAGSRQRRSEQLRAAQCAEGKSAPVIDETSLADVADRAILMNAGCDAQLVAFREKGGAELRGYKDKEGRVRIEPQFPSAEDFSEGRGAARSAANRKWGFVSAQGRFVIEPSYERVLSFSDGRAAVETERGWGFVDRDGRMVVEPKFKYVRRFAEGRAAVRVDKKWGFIDREGKMIVQPAYDGTSDFKGGRAETSEEVREEGGCNDRKVTYREGVMGINGEWIESPRERTRSRPEICFTKSN